MFTDDEGNFNPIQGAIEIASTIAPQYITPVQQVNDVLMQFGFQDPTVKDVRGTGLSAEQESLIPGARRISPFVDQIASRLPLGIGDAIHESLFKEFNKLKISPLLPPGERVRRVDPLLKQIFGTTITEKHMVAQVLDYWGMPYRSYMSRTGDAGLDRRTNLHMQYLLNAYMSPYLLNENSDYNRIVKLHRDNQASVEEVRATITDQLNALKKIASEAAGKESPNLKEALSNYIRPRSEVIKAEDSRRRRLQEATGTLQPTVREEAIALAAKDQFVDPSTNVRIDPNTGQLRQESLMNPVNRSTIPGSEEEALSEEEIKELKREPLIRRRVQKAQ
jgi:hypothetical protein